MLHYRLASQIAFRVLTEFGRLLRFCCLSSWMWLTYCVEFSYISAVLLSYIFVVDDDNWVGECTLHPRCNKAEACSAFIWIGWGWTLQVMLWIFDLSTAKGTETNIGVLLVTGDRGTEQFILASCVLPNCAYTWLLFFSWLAIDYLDIAHGSALPAPVDTILGRRYFAFWSFKTLVLLNNKNLSQWFVERIEFYHAASIVQVGNAVEKSILSIHKCGHLLPFNLITNECCERRGLCHGLLIY